jgi:hypothetical protein
MHESDVENDQNLYGRQPLLTRWQFLLTFVRRAREKGEERDGRVGGREEGRENMSSKVCS